MKKKHRSFARVLTIIFGLITWAVAVIPVVASPPTATTQPATLVTSSGATLNSTVNPNGLSTTIQFQYGLTASYGSSTSSGSIGTTSGNFGTAISGLSPNTLYHFRIVATSSGGTGDGSDLTFTSVSANPPAATTQPATLVTSSGATLNSTVNPNGLSTTIQFQYGLTASYGSSTSSGSIGTTSGNFGTAISGLSPNTLYHFRIVATSSGGTGDGSDLTFTTSVSANPPTATTQPATLVTSSGATLNSTVNPNGLSTTIQFQYGLTASYGSSTSSGSIGTTSGNFGTAISGLSPNTLYHFRIVATSSGGTGDGSDLTFTTSVSANPPTATTQPATLVTSSGATLNSTVNPNGLSTTIQFQYGLTASYGSSTSSGSIGTTSGNFGTAISGLSPNTLYHFRIVATSSGGTGDGSDLTFTTSVSANPPTATTQPATLVTSSGATLNSTVNPNGLSTTIQFQYGLTASYGSSTSSGSIGTTSGNFGTAISGLSPNTLYHFRIVATSSGGTGDGSDLTFTTSASTAQSLGVDVYSGSAPVDWSEVYSSGGKTFAFARASSGIHGADTEFPIYAANAKANAPNLLIGAYHFAYPMYTDQNTGAGEASHFLTVAGNYIGIGYLPPVLDIEDDTVALDWVISAHLTPSELVQWILSWVQTVKNAKNVTPIIYTTKWYVSYMNQDTSSQDLVALANCPLWIANYYNSDPTSVSASLTPWTTWTFQQYATDPTTQGTSSSEGGTCPGIQGTGGYADLDSFNGSADQLNALAGNGSQPPSDTTPPNIAAFSVTPSSVTLGTSFSVGSLSSGHKMLKTSWL